MWTLGFDSTTATVTVALLKDNVQVACYSAMSGTSHSTTLLPAIESLLRASGISVKDLSLISCSAGPGSFTGVRIGVATAKGLAAPFDIPCIGVSSLEAMASMYGEIPSVICPVIGARRGNVYAAVFHSDGNGNITRLTEDDLVAIADVKSFINGCTSHIESTLPLYFTGDAVDEVYSAEGELNSVTLSVTPHTLASPTGYGAGICGYRKFKESGEDAGLYSEASLLPIYLRKSQAEREKEERQLKGN